MERYNNRTGKSDVLGYEIGSDFIKVQFGARGTYVFTYESVSERKVEIMKNLATSGQGLQSYIDRHVGMEHAAESILNLRG